MERYLLKQIKSDLAEKMVFLGGPRQVGKTTLSRTLMPKTGRYLNWDVPIDRESILKKEYPRESFIVFDEIHKYRQWRNYLKGFYDLHKDQKKILVTGSARLDLYRFGGDSLQGRYFYLRMHPLSVAELKLKSQKDFFDLLKLGGFPEPFLKGSESFARRWTRDYRQRLIYEDVTSMEQTQELQKMELMLHHLPNLVGSPLSINSLQEDLQATPRSIGKWVDILERLYGIVRLSPFGSPKIRAVKKEQKHYHYDWSLVAEESVRFENLVAIHLLKWVHFQQDTEGLNWELRYFRDREQREVDFVIVDGKNPILAIEVKWSDAEVSSSLKYFKNKFPNCRCIQLHAIGKKEYSTPSQIEVLNWSSFLGDLC